MNSVHPRKPAALPASELSSVPIWLNRFCPIESSCSLMELRSNWFKSSPNFAAQTATSSMMVGSSSRLDCTNVIRLWIWFTNPTPPRVNSPSSRMTIRRKTIPTEARHERWAERSRKLATGYNR